MPILFAADLGGTKVSAALVDVRGRIRARVVEPTDLSSPLAPVNQIARFAATFSHAKFSAAGIAVPGLVRRDGTVWAPNLPGWKRMPLAPQLRKKLGVPVVVESDRNAAVLGEAWRGAARGKSDVIVLLIGTGIGAGILSGGQLIRGAHELSGCAGWMVITEKDAPLFRRIGCLEALAAGPGIARAARTGSAFEAAQRARAGDQRLRKVFAAAGRRLGLAVANLISLFDPEVIVLGGGLAAAADLLLKPLRQSASSRAQPLSARLVKIVVSKLGGDANLLGVAHLAQSAGSTKKARGAPERKPHQATGGKIEL